MRLELMRIFQIFKLHGRIFLIGLVFWSANGYSQMDNQTEEEIRFLNQISVGVINNPVFPGRSVKYSPVYHVGYKRYVKNFYLRGAFNFSNFSISNVKINLGVQHNFKINKSLILTYATDVVYARTNLVKYVGLAPNVGIEYLIGTQVSLSTEYGVGWAKTISGSYSDLFVINRLFGIVLNYNF